MPYPSLEDTNPPELFSTKRIRLSRERSQKTFRNHNFLYKPVMETLHERVKDIKREFTQALILGGRDKTGSSDFINTTTTLEFSGLLSEEEYLPFKPHSFDLILNPLTLHWVNDIPGILSQLKHTLKPDGLLLGALFGGESLHELKSCLFQAESEQSNATAMRIAPMVTAQMMGNLLQRAGFALPVTDIDRMTVSYDHILDILHDLRGMGETHKLKETKPLTRSILERTQGLYEENFSSIEGKLQATFEIIYFTGWSPHPSQQQPLKRGSAEISLVNFMET